MVTITSGVESEHWAMRFTVWLPSFSLQEVDAVMSFILHVKGQRFGGVSDLSEVPPHKVQIQGNYSAHLLNFHVMLQSLLSWGLLGDRPQGRAACAFTAADVCALGSPLLSLLRLPLPSSTHHVTASTVLS